MIEAQVVNQALVVIVENQEARTIAALKGLREDVFTAAPGEDVRSICEIGRHLLSLRGLLLKMLESPLVDKMPDGKSIASVDDLRQALTAAAKLLSQAMLEYDAGEWHAQPKKVRPGSWGDQPTMVRFARPLNDFVSHLGSIRTIRRSLGNAAE